MEDFGRRTFLLGRITKPHKKTLMEGTVALLTLRMKAILIRRVEQEDKACVIRHSSSLFK